MSAPTRTYPQMDAHISALYQLLHNRDDKPIPYHEGCAFFPPIQFVLAVLGMPKLPKQLYELNHQPGWLSWKTFKKWIGSPPGAIQQRPTQLLKFSKMLASNPSNLGLVQDLVSKDALWRPYSEWLGVVRSVFIHEECSRHWEELLNAEWLLMCKTLPAASSPVERLESLARSDLTSSLGAPGSSERIIGMLSQGLEPEKLIAGADFFNSRMADLISFMLRFAAWFIVDASIWHWEQAVREGKQNKILFEPLLPSKQADGQWSDSVRQCLEDFARLCKCPPDATLPSSLGRIWADHDYSLTTDCDVESKQHLLRDWLTNEMGRPTRQSVQSLAMAMAHKSAVLSGIKDGATSPEEVNNLAYRFHFAETCRFLLQEMQKRAFPNELIEAVYSSFALEYRIARTALGKPLA